MRNVKKVLITLVMLGISLTSFGKSFSTQYCEFQLPSGWECSLEGSEWLCYSSNKERQKEAIIILGAKLRGSQDSLPSYKSYLMQPRTFALPGGKSQVSEAKYTKMTSIKGQNWIDSLHLASEMPGFYTRYLLTVKEDLGVAITLSVSKEHYSSYKSLFDNIAKSIRVFRQRGKALGDYKIKTKKDDILGGSNDIIKDSLGGINVGQKVRKKGQSSGGAMDFALYGLLALVAVGVFIKMKKGKKGAKGKKKKGKKKAKKD